jgi:hypothetical protein
VQETLTDVIVGDCGGGVVPPPPPPQLATIDDRTAIKANRADRLEVLPIIQLRTKVTKVASIVCNLARYSPVFAIQPQS